MSSDSRSKNKSNTYFWRACRFLYPYRPLVIISIVCAVFVSAAFAGGLGTLMPIMRVFLNGDTVRTWADRAIVQHRIGVTFADQNDKLQIIHLDPTMPAAKMGLELGEIVTLPGQAAGPEGVTPTLDALSNPALSSLTLHVRNTVEIHNNEAARAVTLSLPPEPRYMAVGRGIAARFPTNPVMAIGAILGVIVSLAVISNILSFIQEYLSDKAAVLAVNDMRRRLYDHVLHIPLSHFGLKGTSDVTSRLTQDAQNLSEGFKTVLGQSIQEPIKAAMAFGIALWASWKLTLFIIVFTPVMLLIIKKFGKKMRRASKKAMLNSSSMLGQIEGSLLGIRVVKGATAERFERRRYTRIMDKLVIQQLRMSKIDAFTAPTLGTLNLLVVAALVLFATYMVLITKSLGTEQFILVMACLGGIGDSLRRVSKVNNVLQKSNAAAARIFEVLDLPVERERRGGKARRHEGTKARSEDMNNVPAVSASSSPSCLRASVPSCLPSPSSLLPPPRIKLPPMRHDIRFENVTFAYANATSPAVLDVSLEVPKGKSIAIVGHNGSGKTTLLALLPRFYDPQQGRILIDGVDTRSVTLRSLRTQISIVTQDSVIFPGTIADNIAYGNPLATREEITSAARRAFAHEFILEKPQGYDTLLGELGGQLSGGQKQRICIARAILRKSPILVLDEATSQVDAHNEELIQRAIEGVMRERTTFVIAHRFSTIRSADEIVVMDRGRIVGQGRHEELLVTCDTYQQLYERQLFAMPLEAGKGEVAPVG
jgi:ATP-binding cassette, subfamily B, bacterial MsbA